MSRPQIVKTEAKAEIKSSPDKFYAFFKNNMKQLVRTHPENFKSAQLIQGQENCVGSVTLWKYVLGSPMSVKVKIEVIDERNRSITYKALEGEIMQLYKSVKVTLEIGHGFAKWTFDYEKAYEGAPSMDDYANFAGTSVSTGFMLTFLASKYQYVQITGDEFYLL